MKYAEIFNKAAIVRNIPLICEGRELPSGMNAIVVLTRVQYDKHMHAFEEEMKDVLESLKKEGFDERSERNGKRAIKMKMAILSRNRLHQLRKSLKKLKKFVKRKMPMTRSWKSWTLITVKLMIKK